MLRIAALNETLSEDSSGVDEISPPTKEAEESDCLRLYNEALQFRQKKEFNAALNSFLQILSLHAVEKAVKEKNDSEEQAPLTAILQLKYACLKNVGALYEQKKDFESALDAYLEALEIEHTDVTVWYTIGNICKHSANYQLARHAFEQGLVCSPNHWPCLDGLIKILFALGDDVACLFHINKALKKDPVYLMGLVARDLIFQDVPSLKTDIKCLQPEISWDTLFLKSEYTDEEWKATSETARSLRSKITTVYDPQLPLCKQPIKLSSIKSWTDLGCALLKMHHQIKERNDNMKLSRAIKFDFENATEDTTITTPSKLELEDAKMDEIQAENSESKEKDAESNADMNAVENISTSKIQQDSEAQVTDVLAKTELSEKQDSRKRKRSMEQCHLTLKEAQRRSTRSRAYAQQAEEEIYSLRAELRSYLPTALLFSDQEDSQGKLDNEIQLETTGISIRPNLEPEAEQSGALEFISDLESSESTIIQILRRFCCHLATLESYTWSKELNDVFRETYIAVRSQVCGPEVFNEKGIETLIFCEIFLSFQRTDDSSADVPAWFNQDLAFLFQLADPLASSPCRAAFSFQARIFWVHFCWYFQIGQLDEARHYLSMVYNCLNSLRDDSDTGDYIIYSHAYDNFSTFGISQVNQLMQMLQRTLQLADVAKLHQEKDHKQVVEILKAALKDSKASKHTHAPISRPSQWLMLLKSLSSLEDYDDFVVWSERCLNESATEYMQYFANKSNAEAESSDTAHDKHKQRSVDWAEIIETVSIELEEVLRTKRSSFEILNHNALVRLAENLVLICSHQLESDSSNKLPLNSTIFWILLHRMIEFEEIRSSSHKISSPHKEAAEAALEDDVVDGIACSTLFLISAHDLLGKRSWCMIQNGIFVLYLMEVLVRRRRSASEPEDLEELGRAIEQATFCALGYPTSKKIKNKTFCDHGGSHVELTWHLALLVAEYYLPGRQDVPEFDTMKPYSNAEQEALYKKIVGLFPPELDPRNRVEDVEDFIQGRRPNIPKYLLHSGIPRQAENLFYLLADYYFKNKEWTKAIENYTLDLVLVPNRFDSWAALALATGSRLETKVNSCERMKNLKSFLDRAETALRCYRRALSLRSTHTTLWIEQGSTGYMLHSFCAQLLRNETDSINIQMFERLEKEKERMLDIANDCFLAADKSWLAEVEKNNSTDQDERWLHHYMLGKVAEKRVKTFDDYMGYYQKAAQLLEESSAAYPKRISYNTPGHLSVEALEIYYRIHSNCLKILMTQEGKQIDVELCRKVFKQLEIASKGAFATFGKKPEAKQGVCEKEAVKRKAVKHDEEKPSKKCAGDNNEVSQLEGRAATIHEVNLILNEILEKVVSMSKSPCSDQAAGKSPATEVKISDFPAENILQTTECADVVADSIPEQKPPDLPSDSTNSSETDGESSSSSPVEASDSKTEILKPKTPTAELPAEPIPDLRSMIDSCLAAIKECVSRFPHFYKGIYRLAHYYYHSKTNRNLEACRELLLGRALSPSLALLQQQQGMVQLRYLPVGIGGLFNEWRSNNFFHGIWRIPINEIDRPGCFAYHMGRSITLLIDVLRETRDHRLLMELALALQPEPEPDKKYLYDSEREQQASLATSLVLQVLRSRLQELKESALADANSDNHYSSPQQTSPSTSKKLSLLMDIFRTYDRMERNLPGQGVAFTGILVETYKQYRNFKDSNESEESLLEQALDFCRNKQAQSRARISGTRGGISSTSNAISMRGKRVSTGSRRGRLTSSTQPSAVHRDSNFPLPSSSVTNPPPAPLPSHSSVMQEAMKLLQSTGGSAENLPQHLKNIPGISNLLALFKPTPNPQASPSVSKADNQTERSEAKKESTSQKISTSTRPASSSSTQMSSASLPTAVSSSSTTTTPAASSSLLSGFPTTGVPNLGFLDPSMLAMLANPYVNPLSMFTSPLLGSDAAALSKLQQEYQQQIMSSMQNALAQSYVMSSLANPFLPTSRGRGRGGRKPTPRTTDTSKTTQAVDMSKAKAASTVEQPSAMDLSAYGAKLPKPIPKRSSEGSHLNPKPSATRASSLPLDLKLPPPHFEDALKGIKPPSSTEPKKVSGSQPEALKGKSPSQTTSSVQIPKTSFTSIDVAKFLSELPSSLDLKRLPKSDKRQSLPSTLRTKPEDLRPGPSSISSSKPSTSTKLTKTPSVPFPINLGKEITLTTTSSSKGAFPMPAKPAAKQRSQGIVPSVPHLSSGTSMAPGFGASKHEMDPLNLGYSILQNLPSSLSLLVKPSVQNQDKGLASTRDLTVPKKGRPMEQAVQMPRLTPAPQQIGSKKGKSTPVSRPPSLHSNAPLPHPFPQGGNPLLPSAVQKSNSTQPNQPVEKPQKKDSSKQPDIVFLD